MKEIVLPSSGNFARIRPIVWTDLMAATKAPDFQTELLCRLASIDGRALRVDELDAMDVGDVLCIMRVIAANLEKINFSKAVS